MAKRKKDENETPAFEEMMTRLEEIASELEAGELPIEKAIERYEEGVRCYKECHRVLASAEKKVELLTKSADGSLESEPLDAEEPEESADESDETGGAAKEEKAAEEDKGDTGGKDTGQSGTLPF